MLNSRLSQKRLRKSINLSAAKPDRTRHSASRDSVLHTFNQSLSKCYREGRLACLSPAGKTALDSQALSTGLKEANERLSELMNTGKRQSGDLKSISFKISAKPIAQGASVTVEKELVGLRGNLLKMKQTQNTRKNIESRSRPAEEERVERTNEKGEINYELYSKLRESQQLLRSKLHQEEALKQRVVQIVEELKFKESLFEEKLKQEKESLKQRMKQYREKLKLIQEEARRLEDERNFYLGEARRLEVLMLATRTAHTEQQTNLKNIAKGKINVEWYSGLRRARVLAKIIFNSAEPIECLHQRIEKQAGLFLDPAMDSLLPPGPGRLGDSSDCQLRDISAKSALLSECLSYHFVVSILLRTKPFYLERLFDEPKSYLGMFGVWVYHKLEWTTVILDDRPFVGGPTELWNLLLQKALVSKVGSYQQFKQLRVEEVFQFLTGATSYPIAATLQCDKQALANELTRWILEDKIIVAEQKIKEYSRYYLLQQIISKEPRQPKMSRLHAKIRNVDNQIYELSVAHLNGRVLSLRVINFDPEFYFASQQTPLHKDFSYTCDLEVLGSNKAYFKILAEDVPVMYRLEVFLFRQLNNAHLLLGEKKSAFLMEDGKITLYFQHLLEKGSYLLLCKLHRRKGLKPRRRTSQRLIDIIRESSVRLPEESFLRLAAHSQSQIEIDRFQRFTSRKGQLENEVQLLTPVLHSKRILQELGREVQRQGEELEQDSPGEEAERRILDSWKNYLSQRLDA